MKCKNYEYRPKTNTYVEIVRSKGKIKYVTVPSFEVKNTLPKLCIAHGDETNVDMFRVFPNAYQSFVAHSALLNKSRYSWIKTNLTYQKYVSVAKNAYTCLDYNMSTGKCNKRENGSPYISIKKWNNVSYSHKVAYALYVSGYATDKEYAQKLINIIDQYDLVKYDK